MYLKSNNFSTLCGKSNRYRLTILLVLHLLVMPGVQPVYGQRALHGDMDFDSWQQGSFSYYQSTGIFSDTLLFYIDSTDITNIWQVGTTQKPFLQQGLNGKALMTDTLNSYPVNLNSSFYIADISQYPMCGESNFFRFDYKTDTDTLTDYAMLEMSVDSGMTWQNFFTFQHPNIDTWFQAGDVATSTVLFNSGFGDTLPFTGHHDNWIHFEGGINNCMGNRVILRLRFVSDGVHTGKAGIGFDNFTFEAQITDVSEKENPVISIYPNPVTDFFSVNFITDISPLRYEIMNVQGRAVMSGIIIPNEPIHAGALPAGFYLLRLTGRDNVVFTNCLIKM